MQSSPAIDERDMDAQPDCPAIKSLTGRELECIMLVFKGMTNKGIGQQLGISHRTVEIYRSATLRKLGVANSFMAMHRFLKAGFLDTILERR